MALLSGSSEGGCLVVIGDDVASRQDLSDRPIDIRLSDGAGARLCRYRTGTVVIEDAELLGLPLAQARDLARERVTQNR